MKKNLTYAEQIKHPKWQKKRLEVLEANKFTCSNCGNKEKELHVHHRQYQKGVMIWEYIVEELDCLCSDCHAFFHNVDEKIKQGLAALGIESRIQILGYINSLEGPPFHVMDFEEGEYKEYYREGYVDGNRADTEYLFSRLWRKNP